jgi:hypothetical protein
MRTLWLILLLFLLTGCCQPPWEKFEISTPPDRSCRTGTTHGYDVYIWNCQNNQKVVIYQYSTEMTCQKSQKETARCGELTSIEKTLGELGGESCRQVPAIRQWRVKP